jgi:hypothetical protein
MSINDVNRLLHDYRHGVGSYQQQNNRQYNFFVKNTYSSSGYGGNNQSGDNSNYSNRDNIYMSSEYL